MTTPQAPLGSGFGFRSTAREVLRGIRLDGKLALVTGGHAGIGLETTRALAEAGARVVVAARSEGAAREALRGVADVEVEALDLAAPRSIDALAERVLASGRALHFLINNAGIMAAPLSRDARGLESQLAVNHLGHFQLAARLWPALRKARGARVVALSSRGHARAGVDFDDPNFERRAYDKWVAYGQSKTANALFALELDARGAGSGVRAFAAHPGGVLTGLMRHMPEEEQRAILAQPRNAPENLKTVEQGAATAIFCAASPLLEGRGGVYCEDCDVARVTPADSPDPNGVRPWAIDPAAAKRLWSLSEGWLGARFDAA